MKTRFRISKTDTIKGTLTINGKLVSSCYDSGFTRISDVVAYMTPKMSDYDKGRHGVYYFGIYNTDKDEFKLIEKNIKK